MMALLRVAKALLFILLVGFMHTLYAAPLFRSACRRYLALSVLQSRVREP